jgi:hypothetical protein
MKKKIIGIFVCMLLVGTVLPVSGNVLLERVSNPTSFVHLKIYCMLEEAAQITTPRFRMQLIMLLILTQFLFIVGHIMRT